MELFGVSFFNTQPQNDIDRGREAINYFHNEMTKFPSYNFTVTQLADAISVSPTGVSHPDQFLDGLGTAIVAIDMSESQVKQAMERLADASDGKIPSGMSPFYKALSDRIEDISVGDWIGAAPQIAADTAKDAVKGIQAVGDSVIATGKTLTMLAPAVIVAAVLFIVYARTREIAGR